MALGNSVKKSLYKVFTQLCKTFYVYAYHSCFILSQKLEKLLQKEMKDWNFRVYLLTGEVSS